MFLAKVVLSSSLNRKKDILGTVNNETSTNGVSSPVLTATGPLESSIQAKYPLLLENPGLPAVGELDEPLATFPM